MSVRKLNLILIPEKAMTGKGDFRSIAELIKGKCDDIVPRVLSRRHAEWLQFFYLLRPSLYVAFYEARQFKPLRGKCLRGDNMTKSEQYRQLESCGIRTVQWKSISPEQTYDPAVWGPYVIVKPDSGRMGMDVRIRKTGRIRYEKDCPDGQPFLIQKFVHTGEQPVSYRACTFFGEILYLQKSTNTACGSLLNDPSSAEEIGGHNPVATAAKGSAELVFDEEIIAFAKQIALTAFKDIPLLGQDIVRDLSTGELYCLEVNPYGSTWHFSSKAGAGIESANSLDFKKQFNAFDKVADILIRKTREQAR